TARQDVVDAVAVAFKDVLVRQSNALRAVRRWRYNAMMVDGEPVARHGVQVRIRFEL
ncbi:MAG: energy transducer TonB, partial [Myxococcales bacterium]|nr:energy transducer TonB [Myxococcales bacterium]